jgi:5-methylcytosine-specific restriction enzyme A
MTVLDDLLPQKHQRVMDVVAGAGIDISDWSNYADGKDNPAANPRYCYSWCFVQPESFVLLNLWHGELKDAAGTIYQDINYRALTSTFERSGDKATWARRAREVDLALQKAWRDKLLVKVVVCDGQRRDISKPGSSASKVERRHLDLITWAVTQYDWVSGQAVVTRGVPPEPYVDQFTLPANAASTAARTVRLVEVANRSSEVRRTVLRRAGGICELCGQAGFKMPDGRVFLETHHVVPIAEDGPDTVTNVAALCPNHHREAHHGEQRVEIRQTLLAYLAK